MSKSDKCWVIGSILAIPLAGFVYGVSGMGAVIAGAGIGYGLHYWLESLKWRQAGMTMEEVESLRKGFADMQAGRLVEWEDVRRKIIDEEDSQ